MTTDCIKNMLSTQTRGTRTVTPFKHVTASDSSTAKEADSGAEQEGGSEVGWRSSSS